MHAQLTLGSTARDLGAFGEDVACSLLVERGYEILQRNWRCFAGEADIVVEKDGAPALVEVKTRRVAPGRGECFPEEAVTAEKRARYRRIAACYQGQHLESDIIRFHVAAVRVVDGTTAFVRLFEDVCLWDDAL